MVQYAPGPIAPERKPMPTLEEIQTSRKIAEAMMREGSSYEPVGHWTQGAARVAQALVGSMRDSQANSQQKGLQGDANEALMGLYQPPSVTGGMPPIPSSAMQPEPPMSQEEASVGRFANPNVAPSPVAAALDPSLVQAVKGFEGYTPKAQWDYKQHSVGYGTRGKPGEVIDQATAEQRLGDELTKAQNIVQQFAPGAPDGVKKALTSLTYNAGADWTSSGLGAAVKRGDWKEAQRIFLQYNKASGQTLPGLVNRRQQEAQWFNQQPQAQPAMALGGPQQAAQPQPQQMPMQMADASQGQGMTRETLERMLANPLTRDAAQKMILRQAGAGEADYGKNGTIVQDRQGNFYSVQFGANGQKKIEPLQLGDNNLAPSRGVSEVDTGTGTAIIDKATGQDVRTIGKDLAGAEIQKQVGEATGKKIAAAPSDIAVAEDALSILDSIENDPYLDIGTGASSAGNVIWGTGGFDFQTKVDQATSGAFLSAIQQMRGMGALSNTEGQTATSAITRMKTAQSREGFLSALSDYRKTVRRGKEKAAAMLKQGQADNDQSDGWQTLPGGVRIREKR